MRQDTSGNDAVKVELDGSAAGDLTCVDLFVQFYISTLLLISDGNRWRSLRGISKSCHSVVTVAEWSFGEGSIWERFPKMRQSKRGTWRIYLLSP